MGKQTRALVEGAIIAAIFIILLLLVIFTPLNIVLIYILPLPFIVYASRHTWQQSLLVGGVATILSIPFGTILMVPVVLIALFVGIMLGISFRKGHPPMQTLFIGMIANFVSLLLLLFFLSTVLKFDLIKEFTEILRQSFSLNEALFSRFLPGTDGESVNLLDQVITLLQLFFPALIVLSSIFIGAINYWVGYLLLRRLGSEITPFPPLSQLSLPRSILFYYLGVLLLLLIPGLLANDQLYVLISNVQIILQFAFIVQGILFTFFFAHIRGMGRTLPIIAIVLLFIPPFANILILVGIVDLGLRLRQKLTPRK